MVCFCWFTLLLYIWTILSLRSVSVLSLTSFRSCSRSCAAVFIGGRVAIGKRPEVLSLPDFATFLFISMPGMTAQGLLTVSWESFEACFVRPFSSSSTQRRLATENGEVKERLDLCNLSFREELGFWWGCKYEYKLITVAQRSLYVI